MWRDVTVKFFLLIEFSAVLLFKVVRSFFLSWTGVSGLAGGTSFDAIPFVDSIEDENESFFLFDDAESLVVVATYNKISIS